PDSLRRGAVRGLATGLYRMPPEQMLDRFTTLVDRHREQVREDADLRQSLFWVARSSMDGVSQAGALAMLGR
ncbi:MAG TPA: hypothetical protein VF169_04715, partial [Albitalea sp.]|uniref:hypothetical protein n=1 Tax=Piscinibacter sp. TaxID=1903157 RepID=UPI002ED5AE9E